MSEPVDQSPGGDPRYPASAVPSITGVRLSPGDVVQLVNISRSGILVEGRTRFVPGTRITVLFDGGFSPAQMKAKVVRCQVSSIDRGALRYQSGIQFDTRLAATFPEPSSPPGPAPAPAVAPSIAASSSSPRRVMNRW
jgi:PilZ domain